MRPVLQRLTAEASASVSQRLRLYFATGLLLLIPIAVTFFVLKIVFDFLDSILQPLLHALFGITIPGSGLAALILLVLVVGALGSGRLGSRAVGVLQAVLLRLPLVSNIYSASTQLIEIFSGSRAGEDAKRVVVIEYPRPGLWAVGFLMAVTVDESGRSMGVVYIPTAPMPNSGWVAVLPLSDVYETDLSVQQATEFVLSGGILTPADLSKRPLHQRLVDSLHAEIRAQREEIDAHRKELEELQKRVNGAETETAATTGKLESLQNGTNAQAATDPGDGGLEQAPGQGRAELRRRWMRPKE